MVLLGEYKDLSEEWNFKNLLSDKQVSLLHQQKPTRSKGAQSNGLNLEMQAPSFFFMQTQLYAIVES